MKYVAAAAGGLVICAAVAVFQLRGREPSAQAAVASRMLVDSGSRTVGERGGAVDEARSAVAPKRGGAASVQAFARQIENASDLYAAVQNARRSGSPDAIRIARDVVKECFNIASASGSSLTPSKNSAFWVRQSQAMAADGLRTQCSGFFGMSRGAETELLEAMTHEMGVDDGALGRVDAVATKALSHPLSEADRGLLMSALRSRDEVLVNRGIQALAPMLSDMGADPANRPSFWYAAMLGSAVKEVDGVSAFDPTTTLRINQACVADLVCPFPGGELRDTHGDTAMTPEMTRIQQAYVGALKTNTWDAILAVH